MNQLGPYELLGVLGRGGMGTVYRARHQETGDTVAVKALAQNHTHDEHFRTRFSAEIQALLKLDHPNIVRLLGYGENDGALYFAMELVEGKSLYHLQREIRTFDWRDVLVICRDVASGLRHAHDRGIIHRDLKPGNLIKSTDGVIKITDFGIAKEFGVSHDTRDNVVGTIDYMSPEQALGRPVTARSDLYSLGVVLYSLLAGQPPFASNSIEQSLRNLTRVPAPKIRSTVPNVPEALEEVIDELLEKKPENRTPTAYALLRKLDYVEQVLRDGSEAATSHGLKKPSPPKQTSIRPENTFRLGKPGEADQPAADTSAGSKTEQPGAFRRPQLTHSGLDTVVHTDPGVAEPPVPATAKPDYFNPVTDQLRKRIFDPVGEQPKPRTTSWMPVLLSLVVVIAMAVYGVIQATRPPTAEELYEKISLGASRPSQIRDELRKFLMTYPNDPRAAKVRELNEIAEAMQLYTRLSVRLRLPGENRLTQIERDFVENVELAELDPALNLEKLEAFVDLHNAGDETPDEKMQIVSAARCYLAKIRNDADSKIATGRNDVEQAFERARQNPDQALEIYRSVILLYEGIDWAEDLVRQARYELEQLSSGGAGSH